MCLNTIHPLGMEANKMKFKNFLKFHHNFLGIAAFDKVLIYFSAM